MSKVQIKSITYGIGKDENYDEIRVDYDEIRVDYDEIKVDMADAQNYILVRKKDIEEFEKAKNSGEDLYDTFGPYLFTDDWFADYLYEYDDVCISDVEYEEVEKKSLDSYRGKKVAKAFGLFPYNQDEVRNP